MNEKFNQLENELNQFFKERQELIHGTLLAILSRKHVFAVGPPGTAKSMIIRKIAETVKDANYWERLFTRYTVPEEVFGPVKLSQLKQDKFERKIERHLPKANFAFIDEIFKANSSILNSLLTILNERLYHNDGEAIDVPLETMMSASNEIPEDREELGALWDRFLLKYRVRQIQNTQKFKEMLSANDPEVVREKTEEMLSAEDEEDNKDVSITTTLTLDEIHQAQKEVENIEIPEDVIDQLIDIRNTVRREGIRPSDRRYREAIDVVKAEAWFNSRDEATIDDLQILTHILWDEIDHISIVREKIMETTNPLLRKAHRKIDAIRDAWKKVEKADKSEEMTLASEALQKINDAIDGNEEKGKIGLKDIKTQLEQKNRSTDKVKQYIEEAEDIKHNKISKDIMNL